MKKKLLFSILSIALLSACSVTPLEAKALTINRQNNTDSNANESIRNGDSEIHTHSYSDDWSADNEHHWHDSTCGHDAVKDVAQHSFNNWTVSLEPTEYKEGKETRECATCHFIEEKVIPVLEHTHSYSDEWSFNSQYHWHDSECGVDEKKNYEEHSFGDWVIKKEPRDEIEGLKIRTCITCGYEEKQIIDPLPHTHSYSDEWSFDNTHHWHESTCFDDTVDSYEEHTFGNWVVDYLPTAESFGREHKSCVCGYNIYRDIYSITYVLSGATHTNPDVYREDDEISLSDATKTGYTFDNWTLNGNPITKIEKGTTGNLVLIANFTINSHVVSASLSIEGAGSISGIGNHNYGSSVTLVATPNTGYRFSGWYKNDSLVSSSTTYTFVMGDSDVSLETRWSYISYSISYITNGGTHSNPTTYTVADEITLLPATKSHYSFVTWTLNEEPIAKIEKGTTGNLTLVATFRGDIQIVTLNNQNETRGTVSGAGEYEYNSSVTITATPNAGYSFAGWYNSYGSRFSVSTSYTFTITSDVSFEARWSIKTYTITYETNGGSHSNPSTYNVESEITLKSATRTGYTFTGWTLNGEAISKIEKGTTGNLTLVANYSINKYHVSVSKNNEAAGSITGDGYYDFGSNIELIAISNNGYSFAGWYDGDELVSNSETYSFVLDAQDISLIANWNLITYNITYNLNGGSNNSNPSTYNVESEFNLTNPTKYGHTFTGWTLNGEAISKIEKGTTGDLVIDANYSVNSYEVNVVSTDTDKGTVSGSGVYEYGSTILIKAMPKEGYAFEGWYYDAECTNKRNSLPQEYTYTVSPNWNNFYAKFWTIAEAEAEEQRQWDINHGVIPSINNNYLYTINGVTRNSINYGLYPQDLVSDDSLITQLNNLGNSSIQSNGWYLFEGEYYVKETAKTQYTSSSSSNVYTSFTNYQHINVGESYWFKCKPIEWLVLSEDDGTYSMVSRKILDIGCYYNSTLNRTINGSTIKPSNYEYSDVRNWLTVDFYNSAFALDNDNLQEVLVDNSTKTSSSEYNNLNSGGNNTNDKVYLLSYVDYANMDNYKNPPVTDYARAKGAFYQQTKGTYYWTRSPFATMSTNSSYLSKISVISSGDSLFTEQGCTRKDYGIRPGISILM